MDARERMKRINRYLFLIGGAALVLVMMLTVADVIMRELGRPIVGTYEVVGFTAVVVIGFCIPYTTSLGSHVAVTFFTMKLSEGAQKVLLVATRIMGIGLFIFLGYNLIWLGWDLYRSGEVSMTLLMPFYPVPFCIGLCCFFQVVTQIIDVAAILRRKP